MHARSLWATYGTRRRIRRCRCRSRWRRRMIAAYAAAYAWRHYGKSSVQRGVLSVLGWPRWIYKRVKHGVLLGVYGVLVAARHSGITPLVETVSCERLDRAVRVPWRRTDHA